MLRYLAGVFLSLLATSSAMEYDFSQMRESDLYSADSNTQFDEGYVVGQAKARRDLARNYLCVMRYGRELVYEGDIEKILLRRFGIHIKAVAGCMVRPRELGYAHGYNDVSEPEIRRRFGNAVQSAELQAGMRWEQSRRKKKT